MAEDTKTDTGAVQAGAGTAAAPSTGAAAAVTTTAAADAGKAAAAATAGTIVTDAAKTDPAAPPPGDWPQDWRDKMAGGDKDLRKQLDTFQSPLDVYKAHRELQKKLTSGEYKKASAALPANATPEQVAEWRKENGVPDKPEAYDITLPDGLVIGARDKPIVDAFLKGMHESNAPNAVVKSALTTYFKLAEQHRGEAIVADDKAWKTTKATLEAELKQEYPIAQTAIANYMESLPPSLRENLAGARLADGSKLLGNPEGVKFIYALAKEANPAITTVPNSANPAKSIEDELKALNVGSDAYWKDPKAQKRALELYSAQDALAKKKSA